eukprot:Opistho-2@83057
MAGVKKFFNKANQWAAEKTGAEKTVLEEEFVSMEKRTDATEKALKALIDKTQEYLQPNPTARAKFTVKQTLGSKPGKYPQPEGDLGDALIKHGKAIGEDCVLGHAMVVTGESEKQIAEARDALDAEVQANFLKPLEDFLGKEVKDVMFHRKKLESRRLDFDYKRRQRAKDPKMEEETRVAEQKFEESKEASWNGMQNIIANEAEQVSQVHALVEAQLQFHRQSVNILGGLAEQLRDLVQESASQPRSQRKYERQAHSYDDDLGSGGAPVSSHAPPPASRGSAGQGCRALYDFQAENPGELTFREGDLINVRGRLDENWLEGECHGQVGMFPASYVNY